MSLSQYDKTWAQINSVPCRPITQRAVGVIKKPGKVRRTLRALYLYATTNYRWCTSWRVAGY